MALRAFHANPSIGGFGGESTHDILLLDPNSKEGGGGDDYGGGEQSGDALCQIVKELVDNAIDACRASAGDEQQQRQQTKNKHRVKVEVLPCQSNDKILQVTISDNGCGMENIQECVNAFGSSKQGGTTNTAGRYGIGLTLCLLHAQRLVPQSYTCITSATREGRHFTRALYVVDTDGDSVRCDKKETIRKTNQDESGTCVSLLVPGGAMATLAWSRLVNYFKRFCLCPGINCSIEVLAPTLSKVPIFVKAYAVQQSISSHKADEIKKGRDEAWIDGFEDDDDDDENESSTLNPTIDSKQTGRPQHCLGARKKVLHATQSFLSTPLNFASVAHSSQPIRLGITTAAAGGDKSNSHGQPKLEVSVVVRSLKELPDEDVKDEDSQSTSTIQLVRMVNHIPLLDSAEASACGIVNGISNKDLWGSFGLRVENQGHQLVIDTKSSWTPTFELHDSDQVAPFFRVQNHKLWKQAKASSTGSEAEEDSAHSLAGTRKRTRNSCTSTIEQQLMPAKVRLAKVLVTVNILAAPSSLPLPSLSKGRLPLNHGPIEKALLIGLRACLRSLQATNPNLFLTASQLRSAEREAHHMPALASAISRIMCRMSSNTKHSRLISMISQWGNRCKEQSSTSKQVNLCNEADITAVIEKQIASSIAIKQEAMRSASKRKVQKKCDIVEESEFSDLDEVSISGHGLVDENETAAMDVVVGSNGGPCSSDVAPSVAGDSEQSVDPPLDTGVQATTNDDDDDDEWW